MSGESIRKKVEKTLSKKGFGKIKVEVCESVAYIGGELSNWDEVVHAGLCVGKLKSVREVVNDITCPEKPEKPHEPKPLPYGAPKEMPKKCDVVIIGGGVIGCAIARELSRYKLDIALVEKEADVACGASRANNGMVHPGISTPYHSVKRPLNVKGNAMYDQVCKELDVPLDRCGMYVVVTEDTFAPRIKSKIPKFLHKFAYNSIIPYIAIRKAKKYGIPGACRISREQLLKEEPNLTPKAICAISFPTTAMTCPYKLTIAYAENAAMNGVKILLNTKVTGIKVEGGEIRGVETDRGLIEAKYVINAAGVYSDDVAKMAGACDFTIHPRKGSMLIFDSAVKGHINHILAELTVPTDKYTKGGGASVSVDSNLLLGPSAVEQQSKDDTTVSREEMSRILSKYGNLLPNVPQRSMITFFAGIRAPTYKEDFVIGATKVKGFVNVAGIQSPGLASAPAIAEMVAGIMRGIGCKMDANPSFNPVRKDVPEFRKLSQEEQQKLIENNPRYGNVICRCETITEGEIVDAIHRPVPALTMDAIKRRTRAGMGRCQSGFCGPRVAEILARELNVPIISITKDGAGSEVFFGKTK
jgi:glycerol-3-phosphate dehydrogenase